MNFLVSSTFRIAAIASFSFSSRSQTCFKRRPTSTKDALSGSMSDMAKKPNLDEPTLRIMERMVRMPPKPHGEMKVGKPRPAPKKKDASRRPKISGRDRQA